MAWGLVMGANTAGVLWLRGWSGAPLLRVGLLYAAGGLLGFPLGLWAGRLLAGNGGRQRAFAALFVCLAAATVGATAALYALQYRTYYAQWHAPAFTLTWDFQFVFTSLVAFYQFAVLGVRLFFPLGFAALLGVSLLLVRRMR